VVAGEVGGGDDGGGGVVGGGVVGGGEVGGGDDEWLLIVGVGFGLDELRDGVGAPLAAGKDEYGAYEVNDGAVDLDRWCCALV